MTGAGHRPTRKQWPRRRKLDLAITILLAPTPAGLVMGDWYGHRWPK